MKYCIVLTACVLFVATICESTPVDEPLGLNATHAVARGIVTRASDYYCHTHCAAMCGHRPGYCCGADDCTRGSHRCQCYNMCYCGGSGYEYRCYVCDL